MKSGIFLILTLLLLVDLADGSIGQAKFVSTHSATKITHTIYPHHGSVKVDLDCHRRIGGTFLA